MAANKEGAEFRVVLIKGRRCAHLRIEALQDNSPRYQVRRARFDMTEPEWWAEMAGFIAGFMGVVPEDAQ